MAREEILRRRQVLMALPYFIEGLSAYVETRHRENKPADMAIATYHRVGGDGLFESYCSREGCSAYLFQGQLCIDIDCEAVWRMTADEFDAKLKLLSPEQIKEYYSLVGDDLSKLILRLSRPTFFVIYGGEKEKIQIALDLINRLSFLARATGKSSLAHFYLLTCRCGNLTEKADLASALHAEGRLNAVIYNPEGCNGGNRDAGSIVGTFLRYR